MPSAVSIIIPTYNRAALVARCVSSLLAAGVEDLEIIVVDDGGTDATESVVGEVPGVRYVRQKNAGPAVARNLGFEVSRGAYVAFIDSDDEWIAGSPCRLVDQLDSNPEVPLVFADTMMGSVENGFVSFVGTYGGTAFDRIPRTELRSGLQRLDRRAFFQQLATRNVMFLGSLLVRREGFEALGGFDPRLRGAADWDFFMRAAARGPVGFSPGPAVSRYYKYSDSMSADDDHMHQEFIRALDSVRRRGRLDATDREHVERRLRLHLFNWSYRAYDAEDLQLARQRLAWARDINGLGPRELLYLSATYLPPGIVRLLRHTRRAFGV